MIIDNLTLFCSGFYGLEKRLISHWRDYQTLSIMENSIFN